MNCTLLSVLIPTRNRWNYLKFAIKTVLDQWSDEIELIVSDNKSSDETFKNLKNLRDKRISIIQPSRTLSMTEHFNFILKKAKGEWITLFGDDDGLPPYFFKATKKLILKYNTQFDVIYGPRVYFFWPGIKKTSGERSVDFQATSTIEIIKSRDSLNRLLFMKDRYIDHPQFYTGTVFSKKLLDKLTEKNKAKYLINSINPDAYSTAAILLNTNKVLKVGLPLAWVGSSTKSTGFQSGANFRKIKTDQDSLNDFWRLEKKSKIKLSTGFDYLKKNWSFQLIFLEAYYKACQSYIEKRKRPFNKKFLKHLMLTSLSLSYKNLWAEKNKSDLHNLKHFFYFNNISTKLLYVLSILRPLIFLPFWLKEKTLKRLAGFNQKKIIKIIYQSGEKTAPQNILIANQYLQKKPFSSAINSIIKTL